MFQLAFVGGHGVRLSAVTRFKPIAAGVTRTPNSLRKPDPKSGAVANFATAANVARKIRSAES